MKYILNILILIMAMTFADIVTPAYADDVCRNLYDPSKASAYYISDSGSITQDSNHSHTSDYIPAQPGTVYSAQTTTTGIGSNLRIHAYDANKNWLKLVAKVSTPTNTLTTATGTTPANTAYIRVSGYLDTNPQIEQGEPTAYQPYNPLCATCNGRVNTGQWNQLMNGTKRASWSSWSNMSNIVDNTEDNSVSFDFVGGSVWNVANNYSTAQTISGHKYFVTTLVSANVDVSLFDLAYVKSDGSATASFKRVSLQANQQKRVSGITTAKGTGRGLGFEFKSTNPGHMILKDFQIFDLTAMFGEGNEPTIDNAESAIAQHATDLGISATNGYYAYNSGQEISFCAPTIKIATTKYNEDAFAELVTTLNSAITKVTNIVDTTVAQANSIGTLATTKQDRPSDGDCPAGRKCLLVTGTDGKPHWYLIQE